MAGISRVMGGYHIQADNLAGLELGRRVAGEAWAKLLRHYGGAPVPGGPGSPPAQAPHEE
jgi:hypothetical protein